MIGFSIPIHTCRMESEFLLTSPASKEQVSTRKTFVVFSNIVGLSQPRVC